MGDKGKGGSDGGSWVGELSPLFAIQNTQAANAQQEKMLKGLTKWMQPNQYETGLSNMATDYWNTTDTVRDKMANRLGNFMSGQMDPTKLKQFQPLYALARQGPEAQYRVAKEQIMGSTPAGGALSGALNDLRFARAGTIGSLVPQISTQLYQNLFDKAYGMATTSPQVAMGGLGSAGANFGARQGNVIGTRAGLIGARYGGGSGAYNMANQQMAINQQNNMANNQMMGGLGSSLGSMLGGVGDVLGKLVCCFTFVEAHGGILHPVVRQYRDEHMTERNRRGYYRIAEKLVPLMRKNRKILSAVRKFMVDPLTEYGKWHYGQNRTGWIYAPVKSFWMAVFNLLGTRKRFKRANGEVI